jgi:chemotaxis protein MotB
MRRIRRRRRASDHPGRDRWLVSYADFITLLFAFFVVLYASAQVDQRKVNQLSTSIEQAFQQMGIFDSAAGKAAASGSEPTPFEDAQIVANVKRLQAIGRLGYSPQGGLAGSQGRPDMVQVQTKLQEALTAQIESRTVSVTATKEGVVVSLREAGFFDPGSTALRPTAMPALDAIAKVIGPQSMRIRIEGYTDNVPIHSAKYDSNWELSTARATEIIKLLITRYAIAPNRLSASGYGEYYPVASNEKEAGRAVNRRVDLVILNSNGDSSGPSPPPATVTLDSQPSANTPQ